MTRKAAWIGLSFWAALLLAAFFRSEFNLTLLLSAFGLAVLSFSAFKKYRCHTAVCFVSFALGIAVNTGYTNFVYDRLTALDGETVTINGYIKDHSQIDGKYDRVTVSGRINGISTEMSFVLPYDDYRYYDEISVTDTAQIIEDGVKFDSGSYNYSKSIFLQGGYATGSYTLSGRSVNPVFRGIRNYRDRLFSKIIEVCPKREGAFLGAMLCGDKSEMSPAMKTELYRSGLGHVFAVSGIHLVIAVTLFAYAARKLIKADRAVYVLTLLEIWGFALFAGLSVSVVRAAVMLTLTRSGYLFGRKSDSMNSLGLSAVILTITKPYTAVSPSFVLSFLAVAAIAAVSDIRHENEDKLELSNRISASVLFATAPVSAAFFGGVSVMGILTNLLLVPVCTISLQLCFIVMLTGCADIIARPLLMLATLPIKLVLFCADKLAELDLCYVFTASSAVLILVILSSLVMFYVCIKSKDSHKLLLSTVTVLAVWCAAANVCRLLDRDITVTVLPSYRKTAYIISHNGKAIFVDAGCRGKLDSAAQRQMDRLGIHEMQYAFISEKGVLTASAYPDDFFCQPDIIFIGEEILSDGNEKLVTLNKGSTADLGDMKMTAADKGYELSIDDTTVFLGKGRMIINGDEIDISEEKRVLEFRNNKLRRL